MVCYVYLTMGPFNTEDSGTFVLHFKECRFNPRKSLIQCLHWAQANNLARIRVNTFDLFCSYTV